MTDEGPKQERVDAASPEAPPKANPDYVDEFDPGGDFIAPDREPHRDDVRNLGSGSAVGISCLVVVLAAVGIFWMIRGCLMG